MSEEIFIREIKEMSDTSDAPFAMAILDDKLEIAMYGPYHADFASEMPHIPLYTKPRAQPLSDEEIIQIRQAVKAKSTDNWADTLAFAKAIEERHGIK